MIAAVKPHQGKERGICEALHSQGWDIVPIGYEAEVLLIDHDVDRPGYRDVIEAYRAHGAKIVIYPHGANPICTWDGIIEPYPVDALLTIAHGHAEVLARYRYPNPVHVIGWSMCEQRPFKPRKPRSVLFAPIHPLGNGYLLEEGKRANLEAFETVRSWGLATTIRMIGTPEMNGIPAVAGVKYVMAQMDTTLGSIDEHDLVVASGTFMSLAVARGVPTIAMHQIPPTSDPEHPDDPLIPTANAHRYVQYMRYPYDIADPNALFCAQHREATDWRERFIGAQLVPERLSGLLTGLLEPMSQAA